MIDHLRALAILAAVFAVLVVIAVCVRLRRTDDFFLEDMEDWYE